jgi:hypothetical protein
MLSVAGIRIKELSSSKRSPWLWRKVTKTDFTVLICLYQSPRMQLACGLNIQCIPSSPSLDINCCILSSSNSLRALSSSFIAQQNLFHCHIELHVRNIVLQWIFGVIEWENPFLMFQWSLSG